MQWAAIEALGRLGPAAAPALGRLLKLTRDRDDDVWQAAIEALGGLGPAAAPALGRLVEMTRGRRKYVRRTAARALEQIMAGDLRIFAVPVWKRFLLGRTTQRRIEELDPEQRATS